MGRILWWLAAGLLTACAGTQAPPPVVPVAAGASESAAGSRAHAHALTLVNEGDARSKTSVEAAIEKYRQALEVEPGNLDAFWKLSLAYEKKQDWAAVAATLERALRLATKSEYLRGRGRALVELARAGDQTCYERAREPLERCLKVDAKQAECAYLLGEVEEWSEQAQAAAERYTLALRVDPARARYYHALAELYRVFKQPQAAEMVLSEGLRLLPVSEGNQAELAALALAAARLANARHDALTAQTWLDRAEAMSEGASPEVVFQLASIYAAVVFDSPAPRDSGKARRLLNVFVKRVCRGNMAMKFQDQCWVSDRMLQRFEYLDSVAPPVASKVAAPAMVPLPPGLPVPRLEAQPLRVDDAYTVWGAGYSLRSPKHVREVTTKPVAITGYIVKTNFDQAPRCAVHRGGVADPEDCRAAIPAFWLGDRPDAAESDCIKVMGFASNFAQLFDAIRQADSQQPDEPYADSFWGRVVPNPLPAAGAKVTVRGNYRPSFAKASSGAEADLTMGILDYVSRDVLEPAAELATLPGVKRRKR